VLTAPPGRYAVKFDLADKDQETLLAAGAVAAAAGLAMAVTSRNIVHGVTASVRLMPNSAPNATDIAG